MGWGRWGNWGSRGSTSTAPPGSSNIPASATAPYPIPRQETPTPPPPVASGLANLQRIFDQFRQVVQPVLESGGRSLLGPVPQAQDIQGALFSEAFNPQRNQNLSNIIRGQQITRYQSDSDIASWINAIIDEANRKNASLIRDPRSLMNVLNLDNQRKDISSYIQTIPDLNKEKVLAEDFLNSFADIANYPTEFGKALSDSGLSNEEINMLRESIVTTRSDAETQNLIDSLVIGQMGDKFLAKFENPSQDILKQVNIDQYALSVQRDAKNSNIPLNKDGLIKLINADLNNELNIHTGASFEAQAPAIARQLGVDPQTTTAFLTYLRDKGRPSDAFPQFAKPSSNKIFGGWLGQQEGRFESAAGTLLHWGNVALTKPGQATRRGLTELVVSPISAKLHFKQTSPIWNNWETIPNEAKPILENNFGLISVLSTNQQNEILNELQQGPNSKLAVGPRPTVTKGEYEDFVNGLLGQHSAWWQSVINFNDQVVADPYNLLLFRPATNPEAVGRFLKTIDETKDLSFGQRLLAGVKERNLYKIKGGPVVAKFLEPVLRQADNARKPLSAEGAVALIANETSKLPVVDPNSLPGKFIFNLGRSRVFLATKYNQAVNLAHEASLSTDFLIRKAIEEAPDNPGPRLVELVNELRDAYKTDPTKLTGVAEFFQKYGQTPTRGRWLAAHVIGSDEKVGAKIAESLAASVEKGKDIRYLQGGLLKSTEGLGRYALFQKLAPEIPETKPLFRFLRDGDRALFSMQNGIRGVLSKLYLSTTRYLIRNFANDSFRMVLEGYSPFSSVENTIKNLTEVHGVNAIVAHGAGVEYNAANLDDYIKSANKGVELLTQMITPKNRPTVMDYITHINPFSKNRSKLVAYTENASRVKVLGQSYNTGYHAILPQVVDNARILGSNLDKDFPQFTEQTQKLMDEIIRIAEYDPNPGAFEALKAQVKAGYFNSKIRWDREVGAQIPQHLKGTWFRDMTKELAAKAPNQRKTYLNNKIRDLISGIVTNSKTHTPNAEELINLSTESFMNEMDFWMEHGLNTEDAMARALGIYTDRLRKGTAFRAINDSLRIPGVPNTGPVANQAYELIKTAEKEAALKDAELLNGAGADRAADFSKSGLMYKRQVLWNKTYSSLRTQLVKLYQDADMHEIGITGDEIRQGLGLASKQGIDELITSVDGGAAEAGPAAWYLRRIANNKNLYSTLVTKQKLAPEVTTRALETINAVAAHRTDIQTTALEFAGQEANRIMMNYLSTGDLDYLSKFIFPWQFWITRAWPRYMEISARKPYYLSFFNHMEDWIDSQDQGKLARLKGKIPVPFIGNIGSMGTPYFDPIKLFIPVDFIQQAGNDYNAQTSYGIFNAKVQRSGLGISPLLDMLANVTGENGNDPFATTLSLPPIENIANAVFYGLNKMGITDKPLFRITANNASQIATELDSMLHEKNSQWTVEQYKQAQLEWNQQFGNIGGGAGKFDNPIVTNPMLKEAYNRVATRVVVDGNLGIFSGVLLNWLPPGRENQIQFNKDHAATVTEAYRQAALGNTSLIEKLQADPAYASAFLTKTSRTTEREAQRWLARNDYFTQINTVDEELDRKLASLPIFDPSIQSDKFAAQASKDKILQQVMDKYNISKDEILNPHYLALDIVNIIRGLEQGTISPVEASNAINIHVSRQLASLLNLNPRNFVDQYNTFDGKAYHAALNLIESTTPQKYLDAAKMWSNRDATPADAIKKAWEELYINKIYAGITKIDQNVDKQNRAYAINLWTNEARLPSDDEIISYVLKNYPNITQNQIVDILRTNNGILPNFDLYNNIKQQENIINLNKSGQNFRSPNETLINEQNVGEYQQAYNEFQQWSFAKDHGLRTTGLWTGLVEKYWGSGPKTADNIQRINEINSIINRAISNAGASTDEELSNLVQANPDIVKLLDERNNLENQVTQADLRSNLFNGRTTSGFSSYSSKNNDPSNFPAGGVALILTGGHPEWFIEIGNAIKEGREINPNIAAELFAIFKKHSLGFNSFNNWLIAAYNTWIQMGSPGPDIIQNILFQKAQQLSPGETTSIIE